VNKYLKAATKVMLMIEPNDYTRWWFTAHMRYMLT